MRILQQYIGLMLCLPFFLVACSDDDPVTNPPTENETKPQVETIEIEKEPGVFGAEGGSQQFTFTSSGTWLIKIDQDWCTAATMSGKAGTVTVQVSVLPNTYLEERNAALEVVCGKTKKTITVKQKPADAILLSSAKAEVGAKGQDVELQVKANIAYTYEIDSLAAEWIVESKSRAVTTANLRFTVKENEKTTKREGKITFKGEGCTEVFTVYQQGSEPQMVLTASYVALDYTAQRFKIEVQSNTDYQMVMPDAAWLHVDESRALSSYTHYFTVDANTTSKKREAKIEFKAEGIPSQVVSVVQDKQYTFLYMSTYGKTVTLPTLTGSKPVTGYVIWARRSEAYVPGLTHDFSVTWNQEPVNNISVRAENVETVHFDDIRDAFYINIR